MALLYPSLVILFLTLGAQIILRSFGNGRGLIRKWSLRGRSPKQSSRLLRLWLAMTEKKRSELIFKWIFFTAIILIFGFLSYQSYQQYQIWSQDELSKFLLPPYQSINYFLYYIGVRFFVAYAISLLAALVFIVAAKFLNKKYDERFFYQEEFYLGAIGLFLSGHPGWLFYIIAVILIYLLIHLYSLFIIHNSSNRISFYWLWIPAAIFVILIMELWLKSLSMWQILKI